MKETRSLMGMPITVEITDHHVNALALEKVFSYFTYVDRKFSTYKDTSEITAINRATLKLEDSSADMKKIFVLAEQTKQETECYFDIVTNDGSYDPSGLVKGWSIRNAVEILKQDGYQNFYIEAGGDIEAVGHNVNGKYWSVGIKNPWREVEIVKVVYVSERGVATSGSYVRGDHIYDPHDRKKPITDIVSFTIIGPNIYDADRFATAAYAMGRKGIQFIERLPGFEGYMIDRDKVATETTGFENYLTQPL